jgi:hypothetical protein
MTTSKSTYRWQTSNSQRDSGVTAVEGGEAQYIDHSLEEESYELLPSGD